MYGARFCSISGGGLTDLKLIRRSNITTVYKASLVIQSEPAMQDGVGHLWYEASTLYTQNLQEL